MLDALIARRADPQIMAASWALASAGYGVHSRSALGNSRSVLQAVIITCFHIELIKLTRRFRARTAIRLGYRLSLVVYEHVEDGKQVRILRVNQAGMVGH